LPETISHNLNGVEESLFLTLHLRAMESQRPDAGIKDEKAVGLVRQSSGGDLYDFSRIESDHLSDANMRVEWYALVLPEVIELCRKLIGARGGLAGNGGGAWRTPMLVPG
jgi:hypothetical protein